MKNRAIHRYGRRNFIPPHKFRDKGRDCRHLKRNRNAKQRCENKDMPDMNAAGENQPAQTKRKKNLCNLRRDQNFSLIESIGRRASDHGEGKSWKTGCKIDHAEKNRLVRERAHDPALCHHLHPGAGVGDRAADDVAPESARSQKVQRFISNPFFFRAHGQDSYAGSDEAAIIGA